MIWRTRWYERMKANKDSRIGDLLGFLESISPEQLRRAPGTIRAKYPSPGSNYKPVLLLTVVHRVRAGSPFYRDGIIRYAPSTEDFASVYDACYGAGATKPVQPKVTQAFWYLGAGSPRIWRLVANEGRERELESAIGNKEQVKVQTRLLELVSHAEMPEGIMALLRDRTAVRAILAYLKQEFFPPSFQETLDHALSKLK